jgi:hypothetical protein
MKKGAMSSGDVSMKGNLTYIPNSVNQNDVNQ